MNGNGRLEITLMQFGKMVSIYLLVLLVSIYYFYPLYFQYAMIFAVVGLIVILLEEPIRSLGHDINFELGWALEHWFERHEKKLNEINIWSEKNLTYTNMLVAVIILEGITSLWSYASHGLGSWFYLSLAIMLGVSVELLCLRRRERIRTTKTALKIGKQSGIPE